MTSAIRDSAVAIAEREIRAVADKASQDFKNRILKQRFAWPFGRPLSEDYAARKARYKRDPRIMVSTHEYVNSIRVMTRRDGTKYLIVIGHDERKLARDTKTGKPRPGVTMNDIAAYNEHGSVAHGIPKRPHWKPFREELKAMAPLVRARIVRLAIAQARRIMKTI